MSSQAIPPPPLMPLTGPNELTEEGVRTVVITLLFSVLATFAVIGRFWARYLNQFHPVIEDWFVFVGLIFTWGYAAGNIVFAYNGLGVPTASLIAAGRTYQLHNQLKLLIANQVTYAIALGLVKTSILLSLIRIFHVSKKFCIVAYCAIAFCVCWSIQIILIAFLICRPLSYNWDQVNQTGSCGNLTAAYVSIGIVDVMSDIIIFALPIPLINRLQMRKGSKYATMGLFALGIFTIAAGAVRTGMIFKVQFDPTDAEGPTQNLIWAAIEPCVAIIVASLLVIKPLLKFVSEKYTSIVSSFSTGKNRSSKNSGFGSYGNLDQLGSSKHGFSTQVSECEQELRNLEPGEIWRTVEVRVDSDNLSRAHPKSAQHSPVALEV